MNNSKHKKLSKFLSLVLRHKPEAIGLSLDKQGWVSVHELINHMNAHGRKIDRKTLREIVETDEKGRYSFSTHVDSTKIKIRANQGHSISVDLGFERKTPPTLLFHGTAQKNVSSIFEHGLQKRNRHHVHLSTDRETAIKVGRRHGKPIIFKILAAEMDNKGYMFFLSENGVWLTDHVPPHFLVVDDHSITN